MVSACPFDSLTTSDKSSRRSAFLEAHCFSMVGRTLFALQRALFQQPKGMVLSMAKSKLRRSPRRNSFGYSSQPIDTQYGIDTGGLVSASSLRTGKRADLGNFGYEGCKPSVVRAALSSVPDLQDAIFVDIGCGKGRALAVATEFPFRRIIGVELSTPLAETAKENASRIARDFPDRTPIEVIEGDATVVDLPPGYIVAFMYNPAYKPMIRVLARRLANRTDKTLVVYNQPLAGEVFDRLDDFTRYYTARLETPREELCENGAPVESVVMWQTAREPIYSPLAGAGKPIRYRSGMGNID